MNIPEVQSGLEKETEKILPENTIKTVKRYPATYLATMVILLIISVCLLGYSILETHAFNAKETTVSSLSTQLSNANLNLSNTEKDLSNSQSSEQQAQNQASSAQATATQDQTALNTAKGQLSSAQSSLSSVDAKLSSAKACVPLIASIEVQANNYDTDMNSAIKYALASYSAETSGNYSLASSDLELFGNYNDAAYPIITNIQSELGKVSTESCN